MMIPLRLYYRSCISSLALWTMQKVFIYSEKHYDPTNTKATGEDKQ